jgi:lysozyme
MKKGNASLLCVGIFAYWAYSRSDANNNPLRVIESKLLYLMGYAMNTPASKMSLSPSGAAIIKQREGGFRQYPYVDASGHSVGYGHFIKLTDLLSLTKPITLDKGEQLFASDIAVAVNAVRGSVKVEITQNMFDALVDFTYNAGVGALRSSQLLKSLNAGDYQGAANGFDGWHIPASVIGRRDAEKAQFLGV